MKKLISQNHDQNIALLKNKWCEEISEDTWATYEACLSAVATLTLEENNNPLGLILIGPSSGSKTTILNMFRDLPNNMTHYTDKFTPASFLTQAMNVRRDQVANVDLIRKLPNKVFLVPELAPLFGIREEDLRQNMSTLTRVMDGQGLANDGGVHGHREFLEECIFVMLGATVTIKPKVWSVISDMGTRLLFFQINESPIDIEEKLLNQLENNSTFKERTDELKLATEEFVGELFSQNGIRKRKWEYNSGSAEKFLTKISHFVTLLRTKYNEENERFNQMEVPRRVLNQLYNLARGRAIIYGREQLEKSDLDLILSVALSSVPETRGQIVSYLLKCYPNNVTLKQLVPETRFKETKLREELKNLEELGVVKIESGGQADYFKISDDWSELHEIVN